VVVGDAKGYVVLLDGENGMEERRYRVEAAVMGIVWHEGVFVVADMLGNIYGFDKFTIRWKERMNILRNVKIVDTQSCSFGINCT